MESFPLFCFFSSFIIFSSTKLLLAVDTISPVRFIPDGETLVSSSQSFELGFFSPGNSKNRYLGIWYKKSPEMVVWVANRNKPIIDPNGILTISNNGSLVLLNKTKGIIWSSKMSRRVENPVAQLLDTGNLVLRDNFSTNSESYVWQSFDYPSDTLLPGMKLGWDLKTGLERYLRSWRSADDPSPGDFTYRLDNNLLPQISTYNRSVKMARAGSWNGVLFGSTSWDLKFTVDPTVVRNQDEIYYTYESYNSPVIMLLKLNHSGIIQRLIWKERSSAWNVVFSVPNVSCEYYGHCGANSVCGINKTPFCECLKGFKPESQQNQTWPRTCVTSSPLECKSGDRFIKLSGIKLPDLLEVSLNESMNLKECEAKCLMNCSCRAYANSNVSGGGSGCLMWFGDLIDITKNNGVDIFIRVPASEPGNKKLLWIAAIVVVPMVLLPASYILRYWRRKVKEKEEIEATKDMLLFDVSMNIGTSTNELYDGDRTGKGKSKGVRLPLFSFANVSAATNNFSTENKLGEGGFGPVYKGKLLNGQEVAVKRLSRQSGQGLEELKNETMLIAKLQHRNLVRVLGCCIEQGEKILIYEYMSNKSLDSFLFDPTKKCLISWPTRVKIIEGIAQGLLYLHQYSRLRIIHRDLKASNILLDHDMNPKISDFGLARMFGGDELQANTRRIVGTYGYMPPEYALEGLFSIKSDVYSFGVLLLETVSGKKITGVYHNDSHNLLGYAWKLWKDDKALDLMDTELENEAQYPILMRYINVALLCVQENAADRPTMSEVVSMLTNELLALPSPKQPAFWYVKSWQNSISPTSKPGVCSINDITITEMEAR